MSSYTKWHCNMLFMQRDELDSLGVPVLSYDYNDYHTKYDTTVENLLKFLGLKPDPLNGVYVPFKKSGGNYSSWYTPTQYEEAKRLGIIYYRKDNQERLSLDCNMNHRPTGEKELFRPYGGKKINQEETFESRFNIKLRKTRGRGGERK